MFRCKYDRCLRLLKIRMKGAFARIKLKYVLLAAAFVLTVDFFGGFTHVFEDDYHNEFRYPLDIDLEPVLELLRNGQKPNVESINHYPYRYKIENKEKCKMKGVAQDIVLLFLIKSAIVNKEHRDAIRKSWGFEKRFSDVEIRRIFLLGVDPNDAGSQDKIDYESQEHKDIVQAEFIDTYFNNTIKTMMGFKWVVTHCPKSQFIFLVDDDMYVSTKNLLKFLRNPLGLQMVETQSKFQSSGIDNTRRDSYWWSHKYGYTDIKPIYDGRLYAGFVFFSSPLRHKTSKWYISLSEYPFSKFPPYVTAGAVAFTYPALLDMYYASLYTKHFRFDDIYMAIIAKKAGIQPIHNDNMHFWKKSYDRNSYDRVVVSHGFGDTNELLKAWDEQKSLGNA